MDTIRIRLWPPASSHSYNKQTTSTSPTAHLIKVDWDGFRNEMDGSLGSELPLLTTGRRQDNTPVAINVRKENFQPNQIRSFNEVII